MSNRITLFGVQIDVLDRQQSVARLASWLAEPQRDCRYVVTPNVDHIVKLERQPAFRAAYPDAAMVVADGWPVVSAARWLGKPLPETVPGSDLVPDLLAYMAGNAAQPLTVYLLGAGPGVAERAAACIEQSYDQVRVVGCYSPPFGFEKDAAECDAICERIAAAGADLLVLGLGAPKQELWVHDHASRLPVKVALCVGATIDFLAGEKPRAPDWVKKTRMEWCYRMLSEPRRLVKRYAHDALVFPWLFLKEMRKN